MWTRLSIEDFRLLRDVTIEFEPGKPVVLIGPNASGKSSVLQVLGLLRRCAAVGYDTAARELGGFVSAPEQATAVEVFLDIPSREGMLPGVRQLRYTLHGAHGGLYWEALSAQNEDGTEKKLLANDFPPGELSLTNRRTDAVDVIQNPDHKLSLELVRQAHLYPYLEVLREALLGVRVYGGFLTTPLWERDPSETKVSVDRAVLRSRARQRRLRSVPRERLAHRGGARPAQEPRAHRASGVRRRRGFRA